MSPFPSQTATHQHAPLTRFNHLEDQLKESLPHLNKALNTCQYYTEEQFSAVKNKGLSLLTHNLNGFSKKKDDFETLLLNIKHKFDIISVTETHLNSTTEKYTQLGNYNALFNSRRLRTWGGVALFVKSDITFIPRPDLDVLDEGVFESVFVEILKGGRTLIIGTIYRPPSSDSRFFEHLETLLDKIRDKQSYLLGDFNFDLLKSTENADTARFLSDLNTYGMHPLISLPTRITEQTASILDNIFTNDYYRPLSSGLIVSQLSDHLPAFAVYEGPKSDEDKNPQYTYRRDMKTRNKSKFREWVKNWAMDTTSDLSTAAEDPDKFLQQLNDGYDSCFPLKRVKIRKIDILKPWLNDDMLLSKIRQKNRLYAALIKGKTAFTAGKDKLRSFRRDKPHTKKLL